jgi:hypothetical protein
VARWVALPGTPVRAAGGGVSEHYLDDFPRVPGETFGTYWWRMLTDPAVTTAIGATRAADLVPMAEFCRAHDVRPGFGESVNLWGYGSAHIAYAAANSDWWVALTSLVEPTGLDYHRLMEIARKMAADDAEARNGAAPDDVTPVAHDGVDWVFRSLAVMRVFMTYSPWSKEWFDAVEPLMTHAMIHSGLMDKFGDLPTYQMAVDENGDTVALPTGESAAQVWTKDLPSEEVARHQAFRGPFEHLADGAG